MTARPRVLLLALLIAVVAVSSALAGRNDTSFTVTSSLDGKTVLPLRSHWIAYPKIDPSRGQVAEVDYLIDGYHSWTAHNAPWGAGPATRSGSPRTAGSSAPTRPSPPSTCPTATSFWAR